MSRVGRFLMLALLWWPARLLVGTVWFMPLACLTMVAYGAWLPRRVVHALACIAMAPSDYLDATFRVEP